MLVSHRGTIRVKSEPCFRPKPLDLNVLQDIDNVP
jgi:hypothetical protein